MARLLDRIDDEAVVLAMSDATTFHAMQLNNENQPFMKTTAVTTTKRKHGMDMRLGSAEKSDRSSRSNFRSALRANHKINTSRQ